MTHKLAADFDVFKGLKKSFVSTCQQQCQQTTADGKAMVTESHRICYAGILKWLFRSKAERLARSSCSRRLRIDYMYTDRKSAFKRSSEIFFVVSEDGAQWQHEYTACVRPWIQAPIGNYKNSVLIISFLINEELYLC